MDLTAAILILAVTGIGVGFASGLLGVGGCFIMIPVQYWVYTAMGVPPDVAIKVAFGTNLFVVLPTAMSGAFGHSRKGAVFWRAGIVLGIAGAIGAVIGATIAAQLPGRVLMVAFGLTILAGAIRMLTAKPPKIEEEPKDSPLLWAAWGFPLGIVTGIIGIGGGVLMIPVMVLALKFRMHQAVGTSTALMIFTSIGGVIGYIINGFGVEGLPAYSIGYVNLSSWLVLAATSVPMAQVGVLAAHKLPARELKYVFIVVMAYMGLKMIGVFGWLGLPV
ncbi:MAG TPA: sulfite exporter TauE/SafE family protein [Methanosarcinales archaeon]|nr:sulfite exporter TauE/SafE family protein [Methanosarcinales archaeon]